MLVFLLFFYLFVFFFSHLGFMFSFRFFLFLVIPFCLSINTFFRLICNYLLIFFFFFVSLLSRLFYYFYYVMFSNSSPLIHYIYLSITNLLLIFLSTHYFISQFSYLVTCISLLHCRMFSTYFLFASFFLIIFLITFFFHYLKSLNSHSPIHLFKWPIASPDDFLIFLGYYHLFPILFLITLDLK